MLLFCKLSITNDYELWKIGIPILVAVFAFVSNIIYQAIQKRNIAKDRLGNDIIHICDRILRKYVDAEGEALMVAFYSRLLQITTDSKNYDLYNRQLFFHFQNQYDYRSTYYSHKSELVKTTRDFNKYWDDELSKKRIFLVMSRLTHINPRPFTGEFDLLSTESEIRELYHKEASKISMFGFFDAVGVHIVYLQRLVDPKLPLIYITPGEQHNKLLEKLRDYEKNLSSSIVEENHFEI